MTRRYLPLALTLAVGVLLLLAPPTAAVIKIARPLEVFLNDSQFICIAKIDKLFPEKPALVLEIQEDLKGKLPGRRLPVVVKLDPKANNENYVPPLLKRLQLNETVVLFILDREKYIGYGFTRGSWFHIVGDRVDNERTVWSLLSGEPVLRQTYHGTAGDLRQLVIDCLAGKKMPPAVDANTQPGFGPEAKRAAHGPLFGVIPTVTFGAPLAILAILFPTLFGGVFVLFRQWLAFLTVVSLNSSLFLLFLWQGAHWRGRWWGSEAGLWCALTLIVFLGTLWAWAGKWPTCRSARGPCRPPGGPRPWCSARSRSSAAVSHCGWRWRHPPTMFPIFFSSPAPVASPAEPSFIWHAPTCFLVP